MRLHHAVHVCIALCILASTLAQSLAPPVLVPSRPVVNEPVFLLPVVIPPGSEGTRAVVEWGNGDSNVLRLLVGEDDHAEPHFVLDLPHVYDESGEYSVMVQIIDDEEVESFSSAEVEVGEEANVNALSASSSLIDFAGVELGSSLTMAVEIRLEEGEERHELSFSIIQSHMSPDSEFSLRDQSQSQEAACVDGILLSGELTECLLEVEFAANSNGNFGGVLIVDSDAGDFIEIALIGVGFDEIGDGIEHELDFDPFGPVGDSQEIPSVHLDGSTPCRCWDRAFSLFLCLLMYIVHVRVFLLVLYLPSALFGGLSFCVLGMISHPALVLFSLVEINLCSCAQHWKRGGVVPMG